MGIDYRAKFSSPVLLIGLLGAIYCLLNLALPKVSIHELIQTYLIHPGLWLLAAWLVWKRFPAYTVFGKLQVKSSVIQLAIMIGIFQVVFYVIGGLFSGFGKSPNAFTLQGIAGNLILAASTLIGTEFSRAWLVNHLGKKHSFLSIALVAVIFSILSIPLSQITGFKIEMDSIKLINSTWLPLLAENILASLLALLAGPLASISFLGITQAFWWFCPVLPDLPWAFKGIIGSLVPVIGIVAVNSYYRVRSHRNHQRQKRDGAAFPVGWIVTSAVSVMVIWFAVGLFPVQPAVVGSGSMQPVMYAGDIVFITKTPPNIIKSGDIIQFHKENITVMHRVIEIKESEGNKTFFTKGDANSAPDLDPVISDNLIGKVSLVVPKVGWLSIIIKNFFSG